MTFHDKYAKQGKVSKMIKDSGERKHEEAIPGQHTRWSLCGRRNLRRLLLRRSRIRNQVAMEVISRWTRRGNNWRDACIFKAVAATAAVIDEKAIPDLERRFLLPLQ
jgi:hypothetical protein